MFHKRTLHRVQFKKLIAFWCTAWNSIIITIIKVVHIRIFSTNFAFHFPYVVFGCGLVVYIRWAFQRRDKSHELAFMWSEASMMTTRKVDIELQSLQLYMAISVLNLVTANPGCSNSHLSHFKWLLNLDCFVFVAHLHWSTENKTAHLSLMILWVQSRLFCFV